MCGFVGYIKTKENSNLNLANLSKAQSLMFHRGPDSSTIKSWSLGDNMQLAVSFSRLAIIDTSNQGMQPMISGDYGIVFNGEIYNYRDLRSYLETKNIIFKTKTDTEVLLKGLIQDGSNFINNLNGFYAFSFFDLKNKTILLARDYFGKKPLYFNYDNSNPKSFLFSSEIRSIINSNLLSRPKVNEKILNYYFETGSVPQPDTIVKNISMLEAGTILKLNWIDDKVNIIEKKEININYNDKLTFRESIIKSVENRFVADREIGLLLSGGFDSGLILAIARRILDYDVNTITLSFKNNNFDESQSANNWARKFNSNHNQMQFNENINEDDVNNFINSLDQPSADGFNTWLVTKYAKNFAVVLLGGVGADELYCGYHPFTFLKKLNVLNSVRKIDNKSSKNLFLSRTKYSYIGAMIDWIIRGKPSEIQLYTGLRSNGYFNNYEINHINNCKKILSKSSENNYVERLIELYINDYLLNTINRDIDNASMSNSVELRSPFLDTNSFFISKKTSSNKKLLPYNNKSLLRSNFTDLIPIEHHKKKKTGFVVPTFEVLKKDNMIKYLTSKKYMNNSVSVKFLGTNKWHQLINDLKSKKNLQIRDYRNWQIIWQSYILDEWIKINNIDAT